MEPISDLVCMIGALPFQLLLGVVAVIWGIITAFASAYFIGVVWAWPLTIISGICSIIYYCVSIPFIPLILIFPNPFLWGSELLTAFFLANFAGLVTPAGFVLISAIPALIMGILAIIGYAVLTLTFNATGIHLGSTLFQSVLSWITM